MDSMITIARNEDVALLAEGVDRNAAELDITNAAHVALLAEGVDRNTAAVDDNTVTYSRPPRGGRG